jgi:alkanesulfonate monooxygenase
MTDAGAGAADHRLRLFGSLARPPDGVDLGTHLSGTLAALDGIGLDGLLIVQNRKQPGPLAVAAAMLAAGTSLEPFVALSPAYIHPVTACLEVVGLSAAFGRPIGMNLVAGPPPPGGTRPDYARFAEFTDIVRRLLAGEVVSADSGHYRVDRASLGFATEADRDRVWTVVAGSSAEARELSRAQGLRRVSHLTDQGADPAAEITWATHAGIICRPDPEEAWAAARAAFPAPAAGTAAPDGPAWAERIAQAAAAGTDPLYFADPFLTGARPFPYLVGSDAQVAARARLLAERGCRMLVLQRTDEPDNLARAAAALAR